jgi:hypothetical protein
VIQKWTKTQSKSSTNSFIAGMMNSSSAKYVENADSIVLSCVLQQSQSSFSCKAGWHRSRISSTERA